MKKNDGGQAFPTGPETVVRHGEMGSYDSSTGNRPGMTMRQWYKGQAIDAVVRLQMAVSKSGSRMHIDAYQVGQLCADIAGILIAEDCGDIKNPLAEALRNVLPAAKFGNDEQSPPGFWNTEIEIAQKLLESQKESTS